MRLYRFLSAEYGLKSVREKRLRIGRIEELNDDFEFLGLALGQKADRIALREKREQLDLKRGVICMSKTWCNPLMWAHYADSHKGMVLGFDVQGTDFKEVEYVKSRPTLGQIGLSEIDKISEDEIEKLIKIKSSGWSYENECRALLPLTESEFIDGSLHYFMPFSKENLYLREVIVGLRYKGQREEVLEAVADGEVDVFMARGDFDDFKIVRQRQCSMWP